MENVPNLHIRCDGGGHLHVQQSTTWTTRKLLVHFLRVGVTVLFTQVNYIINSLWIHQQLCGGLIIQPTPLLMIPELLCVSVSFLLSTAHWLRLPTDSASHSPPDPRSFSCSFTGTFSEFITCEEDH